jgi:hypothetical protein
MRAALCAPVHARRDLPTASKTSRREWDGPDGDRSVFLRSAAGTKKPVESLWLATGFVYQNGAPVGIRTPNLLIRRKTNSARVAG